MKKIVYILIFITGTISAAGQQTFEHLIFSARLDTLQEVGTQSPSSGNGIGGFTYHDDTLWVDITANGLTGPITGTHIHQAWTGTNGNIVYDLSQFIDGHKIKGYLTGISLEHGALNLFLEGGYYVNIHTAANPAGEIRGQIWPETDRNYKAMLDLGQAGNPGNTAFGLASFNLSLDESEMEVRMLVNGLSGAITNAHLHYGLPGVTGPVAIPLMQYADGNGFQGIIELGSVTDPLGFMDSLQQGKVYVNVHTAMYPGGEIRGQLYLTRPLSFDNWMSSAEETGGVDPSTPPNAAGFYNMLANSRMDTLWVTVQADQLSGPITGAHFHEGKLEESGPVVVDLTSYIDGNMIVATLVEGGPEFTGNLDFDQFVKEALKGDVYVNLHTALNPAGEVRGQASKLAREGAVFSLCSSQESSPVTGSGTGQGSGMITVDRNNDNLHYYLAVAGLSTPVTGAHFHHGLPGVPGPVIYTFPTDSVVTGSWNDDTFTPEVADWFESGEMYANFHTSMNPSGEVRGQVSDNESCDFPIGIGDPAARASLAVSVRPNPVRTAATLTLTLPESGNVSVKLYNILGKEVATLVNGYMDAGEHQARLDSSALPDGIYVYSLIFNGDASRTGKLVVSR